MNYVQGYHTIRVPVARYHSGHTVLGPLTEPPDLPCATAILSQGPTIAEGASGATLAADVPAATPAAALPAATPAAILLAGTPAAIVDAPDANVPAAVPATVVPADNPAAIVDNAAALLPAALHADLVPDVAWSVLESRTATAGDAVNASSPDCVNVPVSVATCSGGHTALVGTRSMADIASAGAPDAVHTGLVAAADCSVPEACASGVSVSAAPAAAVPVPSHAPATGDVAGAVAAHAATTGTPVLADGPHISAPLSATGQLVTGSFEAIQAIACEDETLSSLQPDKLFKITFVQKLTLNDQALLAQRCVMWIYSAIQIDSWILELLKKGDAGILPRQYHPLGLGSYQFDSMKALKDSHAEMYKGIHALHEMQAAKPCTKQPIPEGLRAADAFLTVQAAEKGKTSTGAFQNSAGFKPYVKRMRAFFVHTAILHYCRMKRTAPIADLGVYMHSQDNPSQLVDWDWDLLIKCAPEFCRDGSFNSTASLWAWITSHDCSHQSMNFIKFMAIQLEQGYDAHVVTTKLSDQVGITISVTPRRSSGTANVPQYLSSTSSASSRKRIAAGEPAHKSSRKRR